MPHVLLTADAVGGVWTYTRELALGLRQRRWRVTVAVFGPAPSPAAAAWAAAGGVELRYGGPGLEWMPGAEAAVAAGQRWLEATVQALRPDVLHANQFAAAAAVDGCVPRVLVAHSDVVSWWRSVRGGRPPRQPFFAFYEALAQAGLQAAAAVVAPTAAAAADLRASFAGAGTAWRRLLVIPNGMAGAWEAEQKRGYAVAAGRLWDEAKQMDLLWRADLAMPLKVAGSRLEPGHANAALEGNGPAKAGVEWMGELGPEAMRRLLAGADVFIVPSRYEPFGLSALEAALSGCALLVNDIPSLREVWGEAAAYFRRNDAAALAQELGSLASDARRRQWLARAARRRAEACYGRDAMVRRYVAVYRQAMAASAAGKG
ncbi:MAG: glycosyltransferase family 4 protein [Terriglobales bacterium]